MVRRGPITSRHQHGITMTETIAKPTDVKEITKTVPNGHRDSHFTAAGNPRRPSRYKSNGRRQGPTTKFRPSMCQLVIDMGKEGKSLAQMAMACGITRKGLYDLAASDEHIGPVKSEGEQAGISGEGRKSGENAENGLIFGDALAHARDLSLAWWDAKGHENLENRDLNSGLYKIGVSARFPDVYREKAVIEHQGEIAVEPTGDSRQVARAIVALLQAGIDVPIAEDEDDS